jgi:segregation and condensation protein B
MSQNDLLPELRQIVGALVFGAGRPISVAELRRCIQEVAETEAGAARTFAAVTKQDVAAALELLDRDLRQCHAGFMLAEVAGGFRLQSDAACARWLKHLLRMERPRRLSRPALETLAIVAYRQPVTKAQIEAVRGVGVDHLIKALMELQLIRIGGRSELPGRPLLYGTTQLFLDHFGIKHLDELGNMEPLLALQREQARGAQAGTGAPAPGVAEPSPAVAADQEPAAEAVFETDDDEDDGEDDEDDGEDDEEDEEEEAGA